MVLSNDAGEVTFFLECLREGPLTLIERGIVVLLEPINMAILRGKHNRTSRTTE